VSIFRLLFLCVFLCLGVSSLSVIPENAGASSSAPVILDGVVLDNHDGRVRLSCGVRIADPAPIRDALSEGMDLELVCTGTLHRVRTVLWNETLAEQRFNAVLKGDLLSRRYVLEQEGTRKVFSEDSLAEELNRSWARLDFDLGHWSLIDPGERYVIGINVSLKKTEIPAWVRLPLFFWSWDVVPETSYRMETGHLF
jgi:hypothetical protein